MSPPEYVPGICIKGVRSSSASSKWPARPKKWASALGKFIYPVSGRISQVWQPRLHVPALARRDRGRRWRQQEQQREARTPLQGACSQRVWHGRPAGSPRGQIVPPAPARVDPSKPARSARASQPRRVLADPGIPQHMGRTTKHHTEQDGAPVNRARLRHSLHRRS